MIRCVDVKCPGSGEAGSFLPANLDALRSSDEVKFILADKGDYRFAREFIRTHELATRCGVILSPVGGRVAPAELAEWILEDRLDVRLGLQIHKFIWPHAERGV